ncbi:substrate-binding domain-containing protein [Rhizobacter sp. LjRoot28]|uniref:substrate-binding domain-containing protein n=1 Tax=Rhizobacter sp. LjRoot28 TaxID=3342309 RepID=UPI003ED0BB63
MATIRDVAQLAGVGVATASRVISGNGSFSAAAASRVQAAAAQLGFRPSSVARALSLQSTGSIGVYVPDLFGPFFGKMLGAIDVELRSLNRHMIVANGAGPDDDPRQRALDSAEFLIDRQCDGIIIVSNELRDSDILALRRRVPHLAVVNRAVKGMRSHSFSVDHRRGGALAAEALLAHGHRRIAVISGLASAADNRQRMEGFMETLDLGGVDLSSVTIVDADFSMPGGWAAADELLASGARFTGLFCANDEMAVAAMSRFHLAGLSIPQDISVVAYDNADLGAFLSPRLTTIDTRIDEMGLNACRLLINECYARALPVARDFTPELVLRDSLRSVRR